MSFLPFEKSSTPVPFYVAPQRMITGPDDIQDDNEFKKHVLNSLLDIKDYLYNGLKIYELDVQKGQKGFSESMPRQPSTARPQQGGRKKTRSQKSRRHQKTRRHR